MPLIKRHAVEVILAVFITAVASCGLAATQSWVPGFALGSTRHGQAALISRPLTSAGKAALATGATSVTAALATDQARDIRGKKAQTTAMQAQVQSDLNLALASEARIQAEVERLSASVLSQQKVVDVAQSAEAAADAEATAATRWLTDATRRLDQAKAELRAWALRAYMRSDNLFPVSGVNINELARGEALLSVAVGNQNDVIDVYRQDKIDQLQATGGVRAALAAAHARTKTAADEATNLLGAEKAQEVAQTALQNRIVDLQGESAILAAQEKSIEALIAAEGAAAKVTLARLIPLHLGTTTGLIWPVHGPVTSEFGPRWGGFHPGVDIAAPFGTPIQAARDGVVIFAGWNGGYGNFVLIDHGGGIVTGYAHQSRLAVTRGQTVHQGDVIGYEGSTGYSTGPHVHFEVRINGTPQNPRNYEVGSP